MKPWSSSTRILLAMVAAAALSLQALPVGATVSSQSKIARVMILEGDVGIVELEATATQASCSNPQYSSDGRQWTFLVSTAHGKAILNALLTAHVTRANVVIVGTGACSIGLAREDVSQAHVFSP
ncbi:MAG: hypothetical protein KF738_16845 [Burkholderiales bacterium]|nr:hypothetical protein [Burkholderiales bacterium]